MSRALKLLATPFLAAAMLPAFAQGGAPAQPADPTMQAPAASADGSKVFSGSIVLVKAAYVLKAGNTTYKLDDQAQVKPFKGKTVNVTGSLNKAANTIHVEKIESSASM
jgi:lipopolysaccharide export system protein LptA